MQQRSTFSNLNPEIKPKSWSEVFKWKLLSKQPKWPQLAPLENKVIPPKKVSSPAEICISFVGHVTFLIQTCSFNILTDPVWSERASPFSFIGPKRVTPPGIKWEDLPPIDLVLVSHNHYDHLDLNTIKKLWQRDKPHIITPLNNEKLLQKHIVDIHTTSLDWGQKAIINNNISIHLETAQHWSARSLFDVNKALWGTFVIVTPMGSLCFIGDSGYNPTIFKDIGSKYDILVSLIPIGAYEPRWFMKDVHMNPEEAVLTHHDLRSKYSIASHFETFPLADDHFKQASNELEQARNKYSISPETFITPRIGQSYWFMPSNKERKRV